MKKCILLIVNCLIIYSTYAINGLEGIIVEKYYISDANDTSVDPDGGTLPVGSVTYRIFVDMLPDYKFKAAFGINGHPMKFETSTFFFNNEDRGAMSPTYTSAQAKDNTVMLDSWLSTGAACAGYFGVLKSADNGVGTFVNNDGVLHNNDPYTGIPITTQDGLVAGATQPFVKVNIDNEIQVFGNVNNVGNLFMTSNGSWASLSGSKGPDSLTTNRVLIAQITTNGIFSFELNVQLGTPTGGIEQYVAKNATGAQILEPGLIYTNDPNYTNLNLKAFLEGFYIGNGQMNASIDPVLYPEVCDTITLELASPVLPYSTVATGKGVILVNGNAKIKFLRTLNLSNSSYYLVLKHRNSIEIWSGSPVVFNDNATYDFSISQSQSYGSNLNDVGSLFGESPRWALFSGDISDAGYGLGGIAGIQDGIIESADYSSMENAAYITVSGYVSEDITGDGVVESSDYSIIENNVYFTITTINP